MIKKILTLVMVLVFAVGIVGCTLPEIDETGGQDFPHQEEGEEMNPFEEDSFEEDPFEEDPFEDDADF